MKLSHIKELIDLHPGQSMGFRVDNNNRDDVYFGRAEITTDGLIHVVTRSRDKTCLTHQWLDPGYIIAVNITVRT